MSFDYQSAMVRGISTSFEDSLKISQPAEPIDIIKAERQHQAYIDLLRTIVPSVIEIASNPKHPDCNFIEDTSIIADGIGVISHMGALSRRGEELPVFDALKEELKKETLSKYKLSRLVRLQSPATMDGGDILYTGKHLFVGISKRTNQEAYAALTEIFKDRGVKVHAVQVIQGLHLKSVVSILDESALVVADTEAGHSVANSISALDPSYIFIFVPDAAASNALRVGNTVVIQKGFSQSELILKKACQERNLKVSLLDMSELIKADGALTCGSLLFNN